MITSSQEYYALLHRIQDENRLDITTGANIPPTQMPSEESILKIDLDTRTVSAPDFLAAKGDHRAETFFFEVDRYYDGIDLTTTTCIVQYENTNGEPFIFAVPYYDTVAPIEHGKENKIYFPWLVSKEATMLGKKTAEVKYSVRFYTIRAEDSQNGTTYYLDFCLNTLSNKSKILDTLDVVDTVIDDVEDYLDSANTYEANFIETILARLANVERAYNLYWLEVGTTE